MPGWSSTALLHLRVQPRIPERLLRWGQTSAGETFICNDLLGGGIGIQGDRLRDRSSSTTQDDKDHVTASFPVSDLVPEAKTRRLPINRFDGVARIDSRRIQGRVEWHRRWTATASTSARTQSHRKTVRCFS